MYYSPNHPISCLYSCDSNNISGFVLWLLEAISMNPSRNSLLYSLLPVHFLTSSRLHCNNSYLAITFVCSEIYWHDLTHVHNLWCPNICENLRKIYATISYTCLYPPMLDLAQRSMERVAWQPPDFNMRWYGQVLEVFVWSYLNCYRY